MKLLKANTKQRITSSVILVFIFLYSITLSFGQWRENGSTRVYTYDRAGIGTSVPSHKLHIRTTGWDGIYLQGSNTSDVWLRINNGGGSHYIFDDDSDLHHLKIESANDLVFNTSGPRERMRITRTGGVGIGTSSVPLTYKLAVDGKVICEEVRVEMSADWPDYVFEDSYDLMPLEDLEKHLHKEKHLPGIPSAQNVEAEGIALGEMQKKMMEKIEELTLYVIELNQKLKEQEGIIKTLQQ